MWATPARAISRRRPVGHVLAADANRPRGRGPQPGDHLGQLALPVAGHAGDAERSRPREPRDRSRERRQPVVANRVQAGELPARSSPGVDRARAVRSARDARPIAASSRPTIRRASVRRSVSRGRGRGDDPAPAQDVIRSATASTSSSLWEMKTTQKPSAAIPRSVRISPSRFLRREHRGRLVEDEDPRAAVEQAQDLDPLLLADRELPDPRPRIDAETVPRAQLAQLALDARPSPGSTPRPRSPSSTFSATVNGSTSMKCW